MLYCVFARTTVAHGILTDLSVEDARASIGVVAAFTAADLDLAPIRGSGGPVDHTGMARPPLARDRVRYVGEPVAAVLGPDRALTTDAVGLVDVGIEQLDAVVGFDASLSGDVLLFPQAGTNVGREL